MDATPTKICPDCAEEIKAQARVCRYCGYRFEEDEARAAEVVDVPEGEAPRAASETEAVPPPTRERRWPRDLAYAAAILLWIFCVLLLAGQLADPPRDGAEIASGLVAAVVATLLVGALIRLGYAKLRKRPFWSPWLFVIAALIAFFSYVGQLRQEEDRVNREAVERGVAETVDNVTPAQRCVTRALEDLDTVSPEQRALIPGDDARSFMSRVCAAADREGTLTSSGDVYRSDAFKLAVCIEGILVEFDRIPRAERAFTRADFAIFGERYCREAFSRGFGAGTSLKAREALQDDVLEYLLESGQIKRIR